MVDPDNDSPVPQETPLSTLPRGTAGAGAPEDKAQDGSGPILSESLLRGRNEIQILHRGELYRLCLTRAGNLILHK